MTKLKCVAVDFELADSFVVGDVYDMLDMMGLATTLRMNTA